VQDWRLEIRCEQIRILLRSRNDYLPSAGQKSLSVPGSSWTAYERCPDCPSNRRRHGRCLACDNTGQVKIDKKPEKPIGGSEVPTTAKLLLKLENPEETPYAWERRRERRDQSGSYVALERLLELMPPGLREIIALSYDCELMRPARREREAVVWLAERMPKRILIPKGLYAPVRELRVTATRELAFTGHSPREISKAIGASRRWVESVLSTASDRAAMFPLPVTRQSPGQMV